jgi:putative ABC transport system permease protein
VRNYQLRTGRFVTQADLAGRARVAVLGYKTAQELFPNNAYPVGQTIRIKKMPFKVLGVLSARGQDSHGHDQDDLILVPLETALHRLLNVTYVQAIYVQAVGGNEMGRAEAEIQDLLHQRHRLGSQDDDFTILNQAVLLETERQASRSLTLLTGAVAAISLIVGGVGILAVMLISVRERTHEIGLRRAVGARRRDIRNQFLLESGMLAGLGGLAGIGVGVAASLGVSYLGYWDAILSWPAMAVGFLFSASIGVVFGLYPAMRAAHLQPVEALRAEM